MQQAIKESKAKKSLLTNINIQINNKKEIVLI